ncbi:MAG TPA: helix-turn-helix domain-containing protein [Candidatus Limnocylindria bacterium]|nr:helix-turn-helix domain-containing protein [Candidatus Limnocylindria bacterium]
MSSLLDVWRAVDPEARQVSGSVERLQRPVRGTAATRAAPPHLPPVDDGQLLVADASLVGGSPLDDLVTALDEAGMAPSGVWVVGDESRSLDRAGGELPILLGAGTVAGRVAAIGAYLDGEAERLATLAHDLRLAGAEAALADPQAGAPAGVVAARLRRGVAVSVDGRLVALNPRPAGRALATRFAAAHARLLQERGGGAMTAARRTRDGLWIMERPTGSHGSAWLFDDLPFARADEVALDALAVTLRALRQRPSEPGRSRPPARLPPSTGDVLRDTLLAVARANGRIAPAARSLGVHRNTVLYRLHRASAELGIDPRRPEDALLLLRESVRD